MIQVVLDERFEQKLDAICSMVGTSKTKVVVSVLYDFVSNYCDGNGNFTPRKAQLLESVYEMKARANFGDTNERRVLGDCYVLDEADMMGNPYYKVFFDGRLMKVPQDAVKFSLS